MKCFGRRTATGPRRFPRIREGCSLRVLRLKRAIKGYPWLGIMVDMDAYIEDAPFAKQIPICQFVSGAMKDSAHIADDSGGGRSVMDWARRYRRRGSVAARGLPAYVVRV